MELRRLGRTNIRVSAICLGTMTWGRQNTETDAFAQLDRAVAAGVNFIDTAEMYPTPPGGDAYGVSETILGNWLASRGGREKLFLSTKAIGRASRKLYSYVRDGNPRLDRANLTAAVEGSLKRLRTDYLDLYQPHWPERKTNYFGRLGYTHVEEDKAIPIEETLSALTNLVAAGKIRFVGVSNETAWGTATYLRLAETMGLARLVGIQNPYNLLNRSFEVGLAEIAIRENCGLFAYSPLAFGVLTGKYLKGARPRGCRLTLFDRYSRYDGEAAETATESYLRLAREHGLDPAQMAIAFVVGRPFVTSAIIGQTTLDQLESNLAAADLALPEEVLKGIEDIHARNTNPCP
jgi:aryl-alcohol dehydrogenase-like predicted oxidoreductase